MRIAIYSRPKAIHSIEDIEDLFSALNSYNVDAYFNSYFADYITEVTGQDIPLDHVYTTRGQLEGKIDYIFSYGGDGTFLDCVRMFYGCDTPIVGINSGRLGFLATVSKEGIGLLLENIENKRYTLEARTMLKIKGDIVDDIEYPFAFNEFTVQRESAEMVKSQVYVNGEFVATYWGDGVMLSTPSGSTAYALSVGGPIIAPQHNCFTLLPIASHNLTMRPIVLSDESEVRFEVDSRDNKLYISLDNRKFSIKKTSTFRAMKSKKSIILLKPQNISFYNTLRKKMMWGFDGREMAEEEKITAKKSKPQANK